MSVLSKTLKSGTTQTIAGTTLVGGGTVLGILALLRTVFPGKVPWDETADAEVALVINTALVPVLSRIVARLRGKL